jgi:lipopolysaccharide/colanic/teichoic acid biosynthesis glycosyltransferase
MSKRWIITNALAGTVLAYMTGALILYQLLADQWNLTISVGIAVVWIAAPSWRRLTRKRQLEPLLARPLQTMRNVAGGEFGVRDDRRLRREARLTDAKRDALETLLESRHLVLLIGPRLSGRSQLGYAALTHRFGRYELLRPASPGVGREPPLTKLLTSSVLSVRRRYILWLDDLALLMQAGFDPRSVERWLAAGRGRVALARITPLELQRIKASGTAAAVSLGRAVEVTVPPSQRRAAPGGVEDRYRQLIKKDAPGGKVVRLVASLELLGVAGRDSEVLAKLLKRMGGTPPSDQLLSDLIGEHGSLLSDTDGVIAAHPAILTQVDQELATTVDAVLLDALIDVLDAPGLIAVSQALGIRRRHDDADRALNRGRHMAGTALQPALASAAVRLIELRQGSSGVTLANAGGWDFKEPMGWSQQNKLSTNQPIQASNEVFDASVPSPKREGLGSRFYRLTVYRGAARVVTLAIADTFAVFLASVAALTVRAIAQHQGVAPFDGHLVKLFLPAIGVTIPIAVWLGLYRPDRARAQVSLILLAMTVTSIIVAAVFFVVKADIGSLLALLAMFLVAVLLDGLLRYLYDSTSRRWVRKRDLQARVLILGSAKEARACALSITSSGRPVQAVAFLSNRKEDDPYWSGLYENLENRLIELHIAEVVIADRSLKLDAKADLIDRVQRLGLDVRFVANEDEIILGAVGHTGDHGLVHVPAALMTPEALEIKRIMDKIIVTVTLPAWGLILLAYAGYSKIMWTDQPVFVSTNRVGLGNIGYLMLRLRTRHVHRGEMGRGAEAGGRVERFFERFGLDELPQVINVLRGEMSIVGPRPLAPADVQHLAGAQRRILGTRPGMTGRWQIEWGEAVSRPEMRALDAEYLRRWRLTHDLELIARTPWVIARRRRYLGDTEIRRRLRASARAV